MYDLDDKKKVVKNKEGNVAYTVKYDYTDEYGNKASAEVEIVFDDIPPKVEIRTPNSMEHFNTNAIKVENNTNIAPGAIFATPHLPSRSATTSAPETM